MNNQRTVRGKAKEVPWPQKWSSSEPLRTGGRHCRSGPPTDNPGIRQSHVTILVGISGDDLDWGFSCAGSDTDTNRPELLPTSHLRPLDWPAGRLSDIA